MESFGSHIDLEKIVVKDSAVSDCQDHLQRLHPFLC